MNLKDILIVYVFYAILGAILLTKYIIFHYKINTKYVN